MQILLCDVIQGRKEFYSDNALERVVRSHQKCAALAGSEVNEGKIGKVQSSAFSKVCQHLVKKSWFGWLIRRMECPEQSLPPSDRAAGGINPKIPIVVGISEAPTQARRRRLARKFQKSSYHFERGAQLSFACSAILPVLAYCGEYSWLIGRRIFHGLPSESQTMN